MSRKQNDVGIVGAGPAGTALAIRLRRIGYSVVVVTNGRCQYGIQGLSPRAVEELRSLGAESAVKTITCRSTRAVFWGGGEASPNDEHLVDRRDLDAALCRDAVDSGARLIIGTAPAVLPHTTDTLAVRTRTPGAGHVAATTRHVAARIWVDARGRTLRSGAPMEAHGPPTWAVQQHFRSAAATDFSAIASLPDGWCWTGVRANGEGVLQRVVHGGRGRLTGLRSIDLFGEIKTRNAALGRLLTNVKPVGLPRAYSAAAALRAADPDQFRVGDALLAPDPLSGHGVYEALANSLNVAAAVNTCLRTPQDAPLAHQFVVARARERYHVLAELGHRAYSLERRWSDAEFWRERQQDLRVAERRPVKVSIIRGMPVFDHDRVVPANVLVTPSQPRGVWRVHDVPVTDLLEYLRAGHKLPYAARALDVSLDRAARAAHWLRAERLLFDGQR
jgi:menaquinone-9 beta-reductase